MRWVIAIAAGAVLVGGVLMWKAPDILFALNWGGRDAHAKTAACEHWERDARDAWLSNADLGPITLTTAQYGDQMRNVCP